MNTSTKVITDIIPCPSYALGVRAFVRAAGCFGGTAPECLARVDEGEIPDALARIANAAARTLEMERNPTGPAIAEIGYESQYLVGVGDTRVDEDDIDDLAGLRSRCVLTYGSGRSFVRLVVNHVDRYFDPETVECRLELGFRAHTRYEAAAESGVVHWPVDRFGGSDVWDSICARHSAAMAVLGTLDVQVAPKWSGKGTGPKTNFLGEPCT